MTNTKKQNIRIFVNGLTTAVLLSVLACSSSTGASLSSGSDTTQALEASNANTAANPHIQTVLDTNMCIAASSTINGSKPTLSACTGSQALAWASSGNDQLRLGGKCLDVSNGATANGTLVQLWDCFDNNTNQQWSITNGQIVWLGHNMCLDVKDGNIGSGAALQIWACGTGNRNQQWVMQTASSTASTTAAAASSATSTASAASTTASTASTSRALCKRGIAADAGAALALTAADIATLSSNVTWWYNWYLRAGDATVLAADDKNNVDYVQMVSVSTTSFTDLAANIPAKARYLLTFNEPNFTSQSNITPEEAAALWPKIEAFADQHNLLIVSPAMNYCSSGCNETDPIVWLDKFFAACANCRVDHIAVHAYTCDVSTLKSTTIDPFVKKYNKPMWLTEWDCADSGNILNDVAAQKAYMTESVAYLEAEPNVFRYAWFMAKASGDWANISVLDGNANLTELGKLYLSLPQACQP